MLDRLLVESIADILDARFLSAKGRMGIGNVVVLDMVILRITVC